MSADRMFCLIDSAALAAPARKKLGPEADRVTWVTASERVTEAVRASGSGQIIDLTDGADTGDLRELERSAWLAAQNWHRDPALEPFLHYEGLQLGEATELYWGLYFLWAFQMALGAKRHLSDLANGMRYIVVQTDIKKKCVSGMLPDPEEAFAHKWASFQDFSYQELRVPAKPAAQADRGIDRLRGGVRRALEALRPLTDPRKIAGRTGSFRYLFVSAPQHIAPILRSFRSEDVWYLDEGFRIAKWPMLMENHVRYRSYPDLVRRIPAEGKNRLDRYRSRLRAEADRLKKAFSQNSVLNYAGASIHSWVEDRRDFFFDQMLIDAAGIIESFRAFFKEHGPMTVVVDEDTVLFRKLLVQVAREAGCPTLQIPHSVFLTDTHYDLFPVSSQRVLLGGSGVRDFYLANGVDPGAVRLTGVPRYDRLAKMIGPAARPAVRKRLGLDSDSQIAFLALTTTHPSDPRRKRRELQAGLKDVIELFGGLPQWRLIIKPHPLDFNFDLNRECGGRPVPTGCRVIHKADAMEWFVAADAVLSFPSNTVLEALAAERPTIILDYFPMSYCHVPIWRDLLKSLRVNDAASLQAAWQTLMSDEKTRLYRDIRVWLERYWIGALDARSGERVADVIREEARAAKKEPAGVVPS